jgi:hypothetical protein
MTAPGAAGATTARAAAIATERGSKFPSESSRRGRQ